MSHAVFYTHPLLCVSVAAKALILVYRVTAAPTRSFLRLLYLRFAEVFATRVVCRCTLLLPCPPPPHPPAAVAEVERSTQVIFNPQSSGPWAPSPVSFSAGCRMRLPTT